MATELTRADALGTATSKRTEYFSDFLNSFAKTPFGNQLGRITNEQAVNQSLRNLILTNLGERPFQPYIGSNIRDMLFEMNDDTSLTKAEYYIQTVIENNEPRVNLQSVSVDSGANFLSSAQVVGNEFATSKSFGSEENSIRITIVYNLINNPAPITLTILLKRVR
jgi:phage baseplate assembly protein W